MAEKETLLGSSVPLQSGGHTPSSYTDPLDGRDQDRRGEQRHYRDGSGGAARYQDRKEVVEGARRGRGRYVNSPDPDEQERGRREEKKHTPPLLFVCFPLPASWRQAALVGALAVIFTIAATVSVGSTGNNKYSPSTFVQRTSPRELERHLEGLFAAANSTSPPSRSVLHGYNASADYVQSELEEFHSGLDGISRQYFHSPVWEDGDNHTMSLRSGNIHLALTPYVDFQPMRFSGSTHGAPLVAIAAMLSGRACGEADFAAAKGKVAVVPDTSECTSLYTRAMSAEKAGARAVVVYRTAPDTLLPNERVRDPAWAFNTSLPFVSIPVVGIVHSLANAVADGVSVNMSITATSQVVPTFNLLALRKGTLPYAVVVGAHLDSVPRGPGINDNGSGCAVLLSMARQVAHFSLHPALTIIFAFWGASEEGLLGSRYFVSTLNTTESPVNVPVIANINLDTLASPNYGRFVFDGSSVPGPARRGSEFLQSLYVSYFQSKLEAYEVVPFVISETQTVGSDYLPFVSEGIPAAGVMAGLNVLKNTTQRDRFGGLSGVPFDPCFHDACDDTKNLNVDILTDLAKASAQVTWQIAGSRILVDALGLPT